MLQHHRVEITGRVRDIFAHRFVIENASGERFLADVGPQGAEMFELVSGSEITVEGEMKPSELKVENIKAGDGEFLAIKHRPKPDNDGKLHKKR